MSQWKQFDDYANDSRFASIIRDLPSFVESARSESTNKKYKCYFKK
jgi:TATA-binding protein-associated factor Taf7